MFKNYNIYKQRQTFIFQLSTQELTISVNSFKKSLIFSKELIGDVVEYIVKEVEKPKILKYCRTKIWNYAEQELEILLNKLAKSYRT